MGKLSVSMNVNKDLDINEYLRVFKEMKVDRIFLAFMDRGPFAANERRRKNLNDYKTKSKFFKENGFETALWISSLGWGGEVAEFNREIASKFTRRISIDGKSADDCYCPDNKYFADAMCDFVKDIAASGVEMLMLDDELCLSGARCAGIGCACDHHVDLFGKLIGEDITREEIGNKVFTGSKNKYRDIWFEMQGNSLRNFCRSLRNAVDEVNPDMRMGFCAGYTSFDLEGVDAIELSKILAGNTKPFLRFTGAPYWYGCKRFHDQMLQTIVEVARQQFVWCKDSGIEVFTEADSYPHNRFQTPAAYVEGFDLATRVADNMDSLKYVMGYVSQPQYESGYANIHIKNLGLYEQISDAFDSKKATGIRIYEEMRILQNADLPEKYTGPDPITDWWMDNQTAIIPIASAIPTTYEGNGLCGMAFGEQAKYLPESAFEKGLVLDIKAAEILKAKGVDVGLVSKEPLGYYPVEKFEEYGTDVYAANAYKMTVADGAKVLSTFCNEENENPAVYLYENADGQRFMVYGFNMEEQYVQSPVLMSYCRGRQLNDAIEWLGGKKMPVVCNGHPMLYCICKEDDDEYAAGYFNFHPDEICNAEVELSNKPSKIKFINCEGILSQNSVTIKHIKPYGFAGIVFSKK